MPKRRRLTARRDDTEVIAEAIAWEGGGGFNEEKSKQDGTPLHVLSGIHFRLCKVCVSREQLLVYEFTRQTSSSSSGE